jgi:hypothetical protein
MASVTRRILLAAAVALPLTACKGTNGPAENYGYRIGDTYYWVGDKPEGPEWEPVGKRDGIPVWKRRAKPGD